MQWLKLQTTLRTNDRFVAVSHTAQAFYLHCMMYAGHEGWQDGRLAGPLGAYKERDFVQKLQSFDLKQVNQSLKELLAVGLFERDAGGAFVIARFHEKGTIEATSTDRVRAYRDRKERERNVSETFHGVSGETFQKRPEIEKDNRVTGETLLTTFVTSETGVSERGSEADEGEESDGELPAEKPIAAKRARQTRLVDPTEERACAILAALWPCVETAVGRSMTRTGWCSRNKKIALEFAAVGRSDAELLAAHASVSRRFGAPVYMLAKIADELVRLDNPPLPVPRFERERERAGPYDRPLRVVLPSELT